MSGEVIAVLISGSISILVAVITLSVNRYLTLRQLDQDMRKIEIDYQTQLFDLKSITLPELYKARLEAYTKLNNLLDNFSRSNTQKLNPEKAHILAQQINDWMYAEGGLIQGSKSRALTWLLRDYCLAWKDGEFPKELTYTKDFLQRELRNDLDVPTNGHDSTSLLTEEVKRMVENAVKADNAKNISSHK